MSLCKLYKMGAKSIWFYSACKFRACLLFYFFKCIFIFFVPFGINKYGKIEEFWYLYMHRFEFPGFLSRELWPYYISALWVDLTGLFPNYFWSVCVFLGWIHRIWCIFVYVWVEMYSWRAKNNLCVPYLLVEWLNWDINHTSSIFLELFPNKKLCVCVAIIGSLVELKIILFFISFDI